ncbi:hypothetical protein BDR26DRAFT_876062 [Obelidium mucronatum]|nr:hypothetical protein BDR26DRAFT_876062 [Obelidium mucronatum]
MVFVIQCFHSIEQRIFFVFARSFKDCFKYGYMAFKASTICGLRSPWPCYVTGGVSLLLYWIVLIAGIGFKSPMCEPLTHNKGPLVVLYVYWTVVDVVASAMIIHRVRKVILKSKAVKIDYSEFYQLKFREETRLLFVSVGMTVVTILEIFAAVQDSFSTNLISLWRIVFVYIQLVMVLTSQKVTEGSGGASLSDPKSFSSNAIDKGLITREQKVSKVQSRTANMGSGPNLQHESFEL